MPGLFSRKPLRQKGTAGEQAWPRRPTGRPTSIPRPSALFLDVDGTLLGFEERPGDVVSDQELRHLLDRLVDATDGALALVSGRAIEDLDRIMAPLVLSAGGTHGADLRWPDGRRKAMDAAALSEIRPLAQVFVAAREGLALEDKGAALAIHFRRAPMREGEVARFLEDVVTGHDLMVQHGKMVAEVKSSRSSKGKAIELFIGGAAFRPDGCHSSSATTSRTRMVSKVSTRSVACRSKSAMEASRRLRTIDLRTCRRFAPFSIHSVVRHASSADTSRDHVSFIRLATAHASRVTIRTRSHGIMSGEARRSRRC